jgi:peptidoglycan/xylan/chitin deacetylase (PgdA/CDA1 family)
MKIRFATDRRHSLIIFPIQALIILSIWGCATAPSTVPSTVAEPAKKVRPPTQAERSFRTGDYVILMAIPTDTYESLAQTYLGDGRLAHLISEFNRNAPLQPGKVIVVPLKPVNPGGLYNDGYQTIPILCYHRIIPKKSDNKITVSEENFDRQMGYLKKNGYQTLTVKQFLDFIEYRMRPPRKSVLITFDDGWKSAKTIALPILKKYGFNAVIFLYTDLVNSKPNSMSLTWDEVRAMKESGVFEFGSHTVTHSDLNKISEAKLETELRESQRIIYENIGVKTAILAYPNGLFDRSVVVAMRKCGYRAGFTVIRGGNPFFNNPFSLNRTMVYNSEKMDKLAKMLETYRRN